MTRERSRAVLDVCPACSAETLEVWRESFGRLEAGDVVVDMGIVTASPPCLCACDADGGFELCNR